MREGSDVHWGLPIQHRHQRQAALPWAARCLWDPPVNVMQQRFASQSCMCRAGPLCPPPPPIRAPQTHTDGEHEEPPIWVPVVPEIVLVSVESFFVHFSCGEWSKGIVPPGLLHLKTTQNETVNSKLPPKIRKKNNPTHSPTKLPLRLVPFREMNG